MILDTGRDGWTLGDQPIRRTLVESMSASDERGAFDRIVRILVPYLGENMARAALEVSRRKLGLVGARVQPGEIEPLIEQMKPGLRVFLGAEQTHRILAEIRAALSDEEGNG